MSKSGRLLNLDPFKAAFEERDREPSPGVVPKTVPVPKEVPVPETEPVPNPAPPKNGTSTGTEIGTRPLELGLVPKTVPVPKEVPVTTPHLRYPYEVLDGVMDALKPGPARTLEKLYRLSAGFYKDECTVSLPRLSKSTNVDEKSVRRYLLELEEKGFITRLREDREHRNMDLRGICFRVNLPRMTPPSKGGGTVFGTSPKSGTHKSIKDLKENFKRGVASAKDCPDCNGTGFTYPDGFERGAKKCDHPQLRAEGGQG